MTNIKLIVNIEYKIEEFYEKNGLQLLTIQGELCAPGIQKKQIKAYTTRVVCFYCS